MAVATTDTAIRTGRVTRVFIYVFLLVFALFYLLPFFIMAINSVKPLAEITEGNMMALPQVWTLQPWRDEDPCGARRRGSVTKFSINAAAESYCSLVSKVDNEFVKAEGSFLR